MKAFFTSHIVSSVCYWLQLHVVMSIVCQVSWCFLHTVAMLICVLLFVFSISSHVACVLMRFMCFFCNLYSCVLLHVSKCSMLSDDYLSRFCYFSLWHFSHVPCCQIFLLCGMYLVRVCWLLLSTCSLVACALTVF